jgi:hypothetical protein
LSRCPIPAKPPRQSRRPPGSCCATSRAASGATSRHRCRATFARCCREQLGDPRLELAASNAVDLALQGDVLATGYRTEPPCHP